MKRYVEFITELNKDTQFEQDRILDKISKSGIESLSSNEKEFLDSIKSGKGDEVLKRQQKQSKNTWDDGIFHFELDEVIDESGDIFISGELKYSDQKFVGEIVLDPSGKVHYFMFSPDFSTSKMEINGNPYMMEDTIITVDDNEVVRWSSDEMKEDDTSENAAKEMYDLFHNNMGEFKGRILGMLGMRDDVETFFDMLLEEDDLEMEFYEFIDSIVDDIL